MNKPRSLIDSIDDPRRRDAEKRLTARERKTIVKLEGKTDVDFFKEFGNPSSHIYQTLGLDLRKNGKIHIIRHLKEETNDFGIVDMDYDFLSKEIEENDRIFDTNRSCCLFALVQNSNFGGDLIPFTELVMLKLITNSGNDVLLRLNETLEQNSAEFSALVRERTSARLFRGHAQNVLKVDRIEQGILRMDHSKFPSWSEIGNIDAVSNDLIPEKLTAYFHDFKKEYEEQLENSGFNDHAFREALIMLFAEVFDEGEIPFEEWSSLEEDKWKTLDTIDAAISKVMLELGGATSGGEQPIGRILNQIPHQK